MRRLPACIVFVLLAGLVQGAEPVTPAQLQTVSEAVRPSLVRVEYTLQYADGESPALAGWSTRCPSCGQYHGIETDSDIKQERPTQANGYLITPTLVLAGDPMVHPRFVKSIRVRFGDKTVGARVSAYASRESAVYLTLDEPLAGTRPLAFEEAKTGPYLAVQYLFLDGAWTVSIEPLSGKFTDAGDGRLFTAAPSNALITAIDGKPVAVTLSGELPIDGSWKTSPAGWPQVDAAEMTRRLETLEKLTNATLPRVSLNFRSPRGGSGESMFSRRYGSDEEDQATQRDVPGLLIDTRRVLVLANLKATVTARLQGITVYPASGEPVGATFVCTLKDHGGLIAELEKPIETSMRIRYDDVQAFRRSLLLTADVRIKGDNRRAFFRQGRIASIDRGWKGRMNPTLGGSVSNTFLFDEEGRLIAIPMTLREKVAVRSEYNYQEATLTPMASLQEVLQDPARHSDPNNVPLDDRSEQRLAWLGVELQPLNKELARANNVAHLTEDGDTGALVTFIYPGSPAAKAGVEQGWILLRLHIPDEPKPLDVNIEDIHSYFGSEFPWDQLDQVPPEYLSQLPKPWPSARNMLTEALTELGFGRKFTAEFVHKGETVRKDFEVVLGPDHFDSAPRFKSEPLGMTVCDLTYEVRRYFQKEDKDPGVIVAKVETGGRAAVSKLMPYEIITRVNDTPVASAEEFKSMTASGGELRLNVEGKTRKRVVRLRVPASKPASAPASRSADASAK